MCLKNDLEDQRHEKYEQTAQESRAMIRYVGLDVHKNVIVYCVIDEGGSFIKRGSVVTKREHIIAFAESHLKPTDQVALEATTNTWGIVELLEPYVADITVSNAMKTRIIAEAKVKTDKVDSEVLAQLLRCDYLPSVWKPDKETIRLRELMHRRTSLVAKKTAIKNSIRSVLHQHLIEPPGVALFGEKGMKWLKEFKGFKEDDRFAIDSMLRLLFAVKKEIEEFDKRLERSAFDDTRVGLLMTLPGVSALVALAVTASLGKVERFDSAGKLASYFGLVPSTSQSAKTVRHGPITKQGNSMARWMLIQAAQHARLHTGPIGRFYLRLKKRKGHNIAVVATARKLAAVAWHILKKKEPYRYAQPEPTRNKLSKLRTKVTGERRKSGPKKGTPLSSKNGTGEKTKRVPPLNEVLESEGIPAARTFSELPFGEKRHLVRNKLVTTVRALETAHRVPMRVRKAPQKLVKTQENDSLS